MSLRARSWYRSNTFTHAAFPAQRLAAERDCTVSVCLPARDEARDFSIALPTQDRCEPHQFISAIVAPQRHQEPLLLTDPDPEPEIVRAFSTPSQRREPRFLSIDLAAIEAELAAA